MMSSAVTVWGPVTSISRRFSVTLSDKNFNTTPFKFKMIDVTSSTTPGIDVNSCWTPSISIEIIAAPGRDDNNTLLKALPIVFGFYQP